MSEMSDAWLEPYVLNAGEELPGVLSGVKASRMSTGGSLTIIDSTLDGGPPRHTHLREDESFYLLDGAMDIRCGSKEFHAGTGAFVFLPRGIPHEFHNVGGPARMLIIATPGGLDEYFVDLRTAGGEATREEIERIQRSHGIVHG